MERAALFGTLIPSQLQHTYVVGDGRRTRKCGWIVSIASKLSELSRVEPELVVFGVVRDAVPKPHPQAAKRPAIAEP